MRFRPRAPRIVGTVRRSHRLRTGSAAILVPQPGPAGQPDRAVRTTMSTEQHDPPATSADAAPTARDHRPVRCWSRRESLAVAGVAVAGAAGLTACGAEHGGCRRRVRGLGRSVRRGRGDRGGRHPGRWRQGLRRPQGRRDPADRGRLQGVLGRLHPPGRAPSTASRTASSPARATAASSTSRPARCARVRRRSRCPPKRSPSARTASPSPERRRPAPGVGRRS